MNYSPPLAPVKPKGDSGILVEPELHFAADVVVPDIAGWRRERMPTIPSVAHFTLAPDWRCEVPSPSTKAIDRRKKLPIYARNAISEGWLVDLENDVIHVHCQPTPGSYAVVETKRRGESISPHAFPSFAIGVDDLLG